MASTMDVDPKHHLHSSPLVPHDSRSHLFQVDSEGEEDDRASIPCPFCYVEIDVNLLCRHLQNDHCFDFKNAVCPLCAANLGKEPTGHFVVQHSGSLKRRKRSHKSIFGSSNSAALGNELSSFLGSRANVNGNTSNQMMIQDPVLSPFLRSIPDHCERDEASKATLSSSPDSKGSSPVDEVIEEVYKMKMQRAHFVQQLVASTIF
ncbi:hypothetical protein MLD38_021888 [Melastoma candidum]|uniref:Uncharacterized protein n=1 Tax=Melastoma candidum TaxID=119954 RepID=A0ACB9QJB2_9MYRT|nr:hypothetical protein MLD38_021888 [Melastoma candidum]